MNERDDARRRCAGISGHRPTPLRIVRHHWWPKGWGGPDVESNLIDVCDVCHYGTHRVLDAFRRAGRVLSHEETRAALALTEEESLARVMWTPPGGGSRRGTPLAGPASWTAARRQHGRTTSTSCRRHRT